MRFFNLNYFNTYRFAVNLLLAAFVCLTAVNCGTKTTKQVLQTENEFSAAENAVNINSASAAELEKLPGIGQRRAAAIVEYREKFGAFRRPEDLLLIEGISDKKFRAMRNLIKVK